MCRASLKAEGMSAWSQCQPRKITYVPPCSCTKAAVPRPQVYRDPQVGDVKENFLTAVVGSCDDVVMLGGLH